MDTSSNFWSPTDAPSLDSRFDLSGYDEPNIDDDDVEEIIRNDSFTVSGYDTLARMFKSLEVDLDDDMYEFMDRTRPADG